LTIVSGGELFRVESRGDPAKIVFSGVGKTAAEIDEALIAGIFHFNCESEPELALIEALAHRRGKKARVALRVNPTWMRKRITTFPTGKLAHNSESISRTRRCVRARAAASEPGARRRELPYRLAVDGCRPRDEAMDRVLELIDRLRAKGFDIRARRFWRRPRRRV